MNCASENVQARFSVSFPNRRSVCFVMSVQRSTEDNPSGSLIWVSDGASLTFNGDVTMDGVNNVDILMRNEGATE